MSEKWTSVMVAGRIREAAETLKRLPDAHSGRRLSSSWPDVVLNPQEAYGYTPAGDDPTPPAAGAIDRMDEVLIKWIGWLDREEVRILWSWVLGAPVWLVSRRMGLHRGTVHRKRIATLRKIAVYLNANGVPVLPAAGAE